MLKLDDLKNFYQPAEWTPHNATWTAWPAAEDLWLEELEEAQEQFTEMMEHLAKSDKVNLLVTNEKAKLEAHAQLKHLNINFIDIPYGDIWLRDTAPIFLKSKYENKKALVCYKFNGWGGKYVFPSDDKVSFQIASKIDLPYFMVPLVLEGGSIDVNGQGTALTTRECLLNKNRNSDLTQKQIEELVKKTLGLEKLLWLNQGLRNDHTDGHIDNIARFVSPTKVLCMKASGNDDPNTETYCDIYRDLCKMTNAQGQPLEIVQIPSPGKVKDRSGEIIPASHMNFYISNKTVIVPTYETVYAKEALAMIAECFPDRKTVGVRANAILTGGGSFHCITQQEPL